MAAGVTTVVWFRRNLRLEDNPGLIAAARAGFVIPVFIWCPEEEGQFQPGRVSRWWLKQSLIQLNSSLTHLGASLILKRASQTLQALLEIVQASGATQVFFDHLYDPVSLLRDHKVKQGLAARGISVQTFKGDLLYEPWEIYDDQGQAFTTFAAFWAKFLTMPFEPDPPLLPPRRLLPFPGSLASCDDSLDSLGLENEGEKGSNALLSRAWSPGWPHADRALEKFLSGALRHYLTNRNKTDITTTSLLSPHLHFGEISVRKIFHCVRMQQIRWTKHHHVGGGGEDDDVVVAEGSVNEYLRSLGLREYSRYLCFNFPFTHERSLLANLKHFPWRIDEGYFKSWRQGKTGYPLVDAGMRELWATGWLHCRIRVVVSSFFVKFLQLPWRWGMKYFWDTLLDADLENDVLGWQYISGSLPDGHELDRIDDPGEVGVKLDPKGEYIRKWLPELSRLPTQWIHHPWDAPPAVLRAAGVELGSNYPRPIVKIVAARQRQQVALEEMWERDAAARVLEKLEDRRGGGGDDDQQETMEVRVGRGGRRMDVHKAYVARSARQVGCSSSSWRDQMVPNCVEERQRIDELNVDEAGEEEGGSNAMEIEVESSSNSAEDQRDDDQEEDEEQEDQGAVGSGRTAAGVGKTGEEGPAVPVRSSSLQMAQQNLNNVVKKKQEAESRVPDVRCGFMFRRRPKEDAEQQCAWVRRHLKRKL